MTTVAFDGSTLAVDRQATCGSARSITTKCKQLSSGTFLAFSGAIENGLTLIRWYEDGAKEDQWPKNQADESFARLIVLRHDGVCYEYEQLPVAQPVYGKSAWGSGKDFALAAMECGKDAIEAVEIAARLDVYTGGGVDYSADSPWGLSAENANLL